MSDITDWEKRRRYQWLMCVKKFLFSYNFYLWASGCVAACMGIWFRINRDLKTMIQRLDDSDLTLNSTKIYLSADLLIAAGALIALIGLIGVFGSIKENEFVLFLYSILLVATLGMYAACAGWGFYSFDYLKGIVSDALRELFRKALQDHEQSAKYAVNEIQKQLQCCGNVGPSDYANDIPPSCGLYIIGCNQAFYDFYKRYVLMLSLIGLIFGLTLIIGISCAAYFGKQIIIARRYLRIITGNNRTPRA